MSSKAQLELPVGSLGRCILRKSWAVLAILLAVLCCPSAGFPQWLNQDLIVTYPHKIVIGDPTSTSPAYINPSSTGATFTGDFQFIGAVTFSQGVNPYSIVDTTANVIASSCSVGNMGYATDAISGQNLYLCTSTDTWTLSSGSGNGLNVTNDGTTWTYSGTGGISTPSVTINDAHNSEFDYAVGASGYWPLLPSAVRNQGPSSIQSAGVRYQDNAEGTEPAGPSVKQWSKPSGSTHTSISNWAAIPHPLIFNFTNGGAPLVTGTAYSNGTAYPCTIKGAKIFALSEAGGAVGGTNTFTFWNKPAGDTDPPTVANNVSTAGLVINSGNSADATAADFAVGTGTAVSVGDKWAAHLVPDGTITRAVVTLTCE